MRSLCQAEVSNSFSVVPSAAGLGDTRMPAARMASILSSALPLPPEMTAPAWPIRRPGGALTPAMKPTVGFFLLGFRQKCRSLFLGAAADLADHDDLFRGVVFEKELQAIDEIGAVDGIAADADAGRLAETCGCGLRYGFISECAGARDDADSASLDEYGPA